MSKARNGEVRSFRKGWERVRPVDMPVAKDELMRAMSINNRNTWALCLNGGKPFTVEQIAKVEEVFKRYGVDVADVWDKPREWDITTNYRTGTIRLVHLTPYEIIPFDSPNELLEYARREHIPLPPPWGKAE